MSLLMRTAPLLRWSVKRAALSAAKTLAVQPKRNCYYVLIPEIPEDSAETNSLMQLSEFPNYAGLQGDDALNAVGKRLIEYETAVFNVEEALEDSSFPRTFGAIFDPIEEAAVALHSAWSGLRLQILVQEDPDARSAYVALEKRIDDAWPQVYVKPRIYEAVKEMQARIGDFEPDQQRVIEKYIREAENSYLNLSKESQTKFRRLAGSLEHYLEAYKRNLTEAKTFFRHHCAEDVFKNFPENAVKHFATTTGFLVTLFEPQYSLFMKYCAEPMQRKNLYQANRILASTSNVPNANNCFTVTYIRQCRADMAELRGYKNHWEFSLKAKNGPAESVVSETLNNLALDTRPIVASQLAELKKFCSEKGFKAPLEQWDLPYWRRRYEDANLALDEQEMKQVFSTENVLKGLQNLADKVFGVELEESKSNQIWHKDAKLLRISHGGKQRGSIVLDLPSRENKTFGNWCELVRRRSKASPVNPSTAIVMSLRNRTHLDLDEFQSLVGHLGRSLQHVLSTARYIDVSGVYNVPWHMTGVCNNLFELMLLDGRIAKIICPDLSDATHAKIKQRMQHLRAVDFQQEVFLSMLDMELHRRTNINAQDLAEGLHKHVLTSFSHHLFETLQICSMPDIIVGQKAATYYGSVWSKMIAADAFAALTEKDDVESIQKVGQRFCENMFLNAGNVPAEEAFRRFRGRDPVVEPLLSLIAGK